MKSCRNRGSLLIRHLTVSTLLFSACTSALAINTNILWEVGNPLRARYPSNTGTNPCARSISDMYVYDGKIYLGSGDGLNNQGPVDLWTYSGDGANFINEYVVQDEYINNFYEYDGKLFIPGGDPHARNLPGNIHINDPKRTPNPGWVTYAQPPDGEHGGDIVLFKSNLYYSTRYARVNFSSNHTWKSTDMGQSWVHINSTTAYNMVVFDDYIFFEGNSLGVTNCWTFDNQTWRQVWPSLGLTQLPNRRARYLNGLLYAEVYQYALQTSPLYYITTAQITNSGTATKIAAFTNKCVRDIVVRGDVCYVMTTEEIQRDVLYRGTISHSVDLVNWVVDSVFEVPGIPYSFEILNNHFYVGLGARPISSSGLDWEKYWVGTNSGSIWRIAPTNQAVVTLATNSPFCGYLCGAGTYPVDWQVQIKAEPNPGWRFTGWGDGNTNNPRKILVPSNGVTHVANFTNALTPPLYWPADGALVWDRRSEFFWPAITGATWYNLWISRNGQAYLDQWVEAATNWVPSVDGLPGGSYQWWVRPWGPSIGTGGWSPEAAFSIPWAKPSDLDMFGPQGMKTNYNLDYSWWKDANATWYNLWVGRVGASQWHNLWYQILGEGTVSVNPGGTYPGPAKPIQTEPTGTISGNLPTFRWNGGLCTWWLRGWGPDGYGPWSGPMFFGIPHATGTWYRVYANRGGSNVVDQWVQANELL